jgi:hypothetical protein
MWNWRAVASRQSIGALNLGGIGDCEFGKSFAMILGHRDPGFQWSGRTGERAPCEPTVAAVATLPLELATAFAAFNLGVITMA